MIFCNINNLNDAWDEFKTHIKTTIDKHTPFIEKKISGRENPWLSAEIKLEMRSRDYLLRKARNSGTEIDWSNYKRARNIVDTHIRTSKANYNKQLFRETNSPKDFWAKIKRIYPNKSNRSKVNLFKINGEVTTDSSVIANGFCNFF